MFGACLDVAIKVAQLAAAVSAVVLVFITGPRELRKWRRQRLEERRAEVAGQALVASLDLLQAMDNVSTPVGLKGDATQTEGQSYTEYMRVWFGKRMERLQPQIDALTRIRMQAHVYLSNAQSQALDNVSSHVNEVIGEFMTWVIFNESGPGREPEKAQASFLRVFGDEFKKTREELKARATEALRDSAQFKGGR